MKDKIPFLQKLKSIKHIEWIIVGLASLIILALYFVPLGTKQNTSNNESYFEKVENKLSMVISNIKGVGNCKVIINWKLNTEDALDNNSQSNNYDFGIGGTDYGKYFPEPIGVIVVCSGGGNIRIKLQITSAVCSFLNISETSVNVLEGK